VGAIEAFDRLNERQREAARFPGRPLLIIAGAGTGKTSTLAHRVAHLVLEGVAPEAILLLTFTRRAAAEMTRRAQRIVGEAHASAAVTAQRGRAYDPTGQPLVTAPLGAPAGAPCPHCGVDRARDDRLGRP